MSPHTMTRAGGGLGQVGRFGLVGIANTAIDFAVTNLCGILFASRDTITLMVVAVAGCVAASANSYVLNRRWTFRDSEPSSGGGSVVRFAGMVLLGLAVNTSVFLFCHRYLHALRGVPDMAALNLSKLAGVAAAMGVTFVGYRFGVFRHAGVIDFRDRFHFAAAGRVPLATQLAVVTAVSAVLRGLYLCRTTTVFGDAVNYAWVARGIATGRGAEVDTFWSSLYCFWEAGFHAFGLAPTTAAISASFLPGVLLAGAVTWLARNLYGSTVAWIAGLLCCVHPRLVEYACNGYAESFYLLAFTLGVGCLTRIIQQPSLVLAIGWGIGFGLYASVRNEGLLAFAASLLLLPAAGVARGWRPRLRGAWLPAAASVAGFACVVTTYAGLSRATVGTCGVFQKGANLGKQFSEQLDAHAAARETYGGTGTMFGRPAARPRLLDEAAVLARRYPANLYYTLQRLPGVLLSPLPLFALLLPMVARHRGRAPGDERPLALMLAFPLAFYPCIQVEPRLLMPVLVPLHVFGAAGLVAIAAYLFPEPRGARVIRTATLAMLAVACLLTAWRAGQVERTYGFHRNLAGFLASHVAPGEPIVGCGYGNVTTTAFLAGRPAVPRLWTDHPEELARFVAARRSHWLVLYEPFLRDANPELLGALDHGVPGFERACEVRDAQGRRSQIFRLKEKT